MEIFKLLRDTRWGKKRLGWKFKNLRQFLKKKTIKNHQDNESSLDQYVNEKMGEKVKKMKIFPKI